MQEQGGVDYQPLCRTLANLLRLSHQLQVAMNRHSKGVVDLTIEQVFALCSIDLSGGRDSISGIAASLGLENHSVSAMIDNLERLGLVERLRDTGDDRRKVWVRMTAEGAARLQSFRSTLPTLFPVLFSATSAESAGTLQAAIDTIADFFEG